jgi:hypothetical protein
MINSHRGLAVVSTSTSSSGTQHELTCSWLASLTWVKASASVGTGACVELALHGQAIFIRDSKAPDGPALRYTFAEVAAFLDGAKRGEFDHLLPGALVRRRRWSRWRPDRNRPQ